MTYIDKGFTFLSQIINLPVFDAETGDKIGRVLDALAVPREMYPKIISLIIQLKKEGKRLNLPLKEIKKIVENKAIYARIPSDHLAELVGVGENEILLKEVFLDKQIVDISGAKVVRVNDLHLLKEPSNLWVVHMDVGFSGLLRRLGVLRPCNFIFRILFSRELKDKLISWKYVQPISSASMNESLKLKIDNAGLSQLLPADLADILADLGVDEREIVFNSLDISTAAKTLEELPSKIRIQIAESLSQLRLANIINEMPMDEVVDLMADLPKKLVHSLFRILPQEEVKQIKGLLEHSEDIAGSLMNTEFISARLNATTGDVLDRLRTEAERTESFSYIYILDENDFLLGVITLRQLLTEPPDRPVSEFMRSQVVSAKINTDVKDVAQVFIKYDFHLLPVVDDDNRMHGVITMKDAFESVFSEIRD